MAKPRQDEESNSGDGQSLHAGSYSLQKAGKEESRQTRTWYVGCLYDGNNVSVSALRTRMLKS